MINKTPEVGRILVLESVIHDAYFRRGGQITSVKGKRINYTDQHGEEKFVRNIGAVCDTEEEVEQLLEFGQRAFKEVADLRERHKQERARLMGEAKLSI